MVVTGLILKNFSATWGVYASKSVPSHLRRDIFIEILPKKIPPKNLFYVKKNIPPYKKIPRNSGPVCSPNFLLKEGVQLHRLHRTVFAPPLLFIPY